MVEQETINHLVKTFRLAIANLRIYPLSSQIVSATLETFYKTISGAVESSKTLTFSRLADKLLINSEEPKAKDTQMAAIMVLKLFSQKNIQSITFRQGLAKDELTGFLLDILKKKRDELPQYQNIDLDKTVYVSTIKGEETVVKISETIKNSGGDIVGLIKSVRESYDMIDEVPYDNLREQLQDHLAQELAKQDTEVLRDIFDRDLPPKLEQSGLKKRLLSSLSREKIQDIFGEISDWYEEIRKMEGSDFAAVEQLEKLKKFMHSILKAPAAKEIPRQFFEELLRKGLINELPEWFSGELSKPTTVFEVEKILEQPAAEILEKNTLDSLPGLVKKLCEIENNELLGKLIDKLLENLSNTAAKIRLPAVKSLAELYNILDAAGKDNFTKYMEFPALETAKKETSSDVYFYLSELLRFRAVKNIFHADYPSVIEILNLFRKHKIEETMPDQQIRSHAQTALSHILPEISDVLINDLKSGIQEKSSGSIEVLSKFETAAVNALIKVIKTSNDIHSRKLAASALKNIGNPAVKRFYEELNLGLTAEEIKNVVEALKILGTGEAAKPLSSLLHFPDPEVKKGILRFLAGIDSNQSKSVIINHLNDEDEAVVKEAVSLLAEIKCKEAVPVLIDKMKSASKSYDIQEQICIALGKIQDFRAAAALVQKLKKRASWFTANKPSFDKVRLRAAWALRKFKGHEIEAALEKAMKDPNISVASTARESLGIIKDGNQ
jgi:HEAT repeat protein